MTQQLLHRADVVSVFQQMGCKAVPESMAAHRLIESNQMDCPFDGFMKC